MRVLAGDIGGTKTRLAVFRVDGTDLETEALESYPSKDFASLEDIVARFRESHDAAVTAACFGIAGPVRAGRSQTTNLPWLVDAQVLARAHQLTKVSLINDLEANAWGINALQPKDFQVLNEGVEGGEGNRAVIAAGTGLGEAGMFWDGTLHKPFASEGGHSDFAPGDPLQVALWHYLRERFAGHVSWERVLSGPGLINLYEFLTQHLGVNAPEWLIEAFRAEDNAAVISRTAMEGRDEVCSLALDLFVKLYGAETGNHALKIMATGGVYLGGGIAPKIISRLQAPAFLQAFVDKGRMRGLMESMPVQVILNDRTALYGPALFAARTAD